ncbi:MAG: iron-containing alcohol dehydrogenase [Coprococcus sp.]
MHTMERYFTNGGNMEITDSIAEGLMRTVIENARILVRDPKNYDARAEVMWAGSLSHNGLTWLRRCQVRRRPPHLMRWNMR